MHKPIPAWQSEADFIKEFVAFDEPGYDIIESAPSVPPTPSPARAVKPTAHAPLDVHAPSPHSEIIIEATRLLALERIVALTTILVNPETTMFEADRLRAKIRTLIES